MSTSLAGNHPQASEIQFIARISPIVVPAKAGIHQNNFALILSTKYDSLPQSPLIQIDI
jgi:hypothetical protein